MFRVLVRFTFNPLHGNWSLVMPTPVQISILLLICLMSGGCGQAKYEERLKASAEFYEYMQTVEANLSSPIWERSDLGIKMRLPLPFRHTMPGPELLIDDDGNQYSGPDPRQPSYLGGQLPGILEAWQAELPGEAGEAVESRIYLLTNHSRFKLVDGAVVEPPIEFLTDLETLLSNIFNVEIPEGESDRPADHVRFPLIVPAASSQHAKFTQPKRYSVIRFVTDQPLEGRELQVVLHEHMAGDIQVAILAVGPKSFSAQFRQRLELALQTLSVQPQMAAQMDKSTGKVQQGGVRGF